MNIVTVRNDHDAFLARQSLLGDETIVVDLRPCPLSFRTGLSVEQYGHPLDYLDRAAFFGASIVNLAAFVADARAVAS